MNPGGQSQTAVWLKGLHSWSTAHASGIEQGSVQIPLKQARSVGQSLMLVQPMALQPAAGLPFVPGGHSQTGLCWIPLQVAPLSQVAGKQTCLHCPLTQACVPGHSSSTRQPTLKQATNGSPVIPSGQAQTGLRLTTRHMESGAQSQGLSQTPLRQASWAGQSSSALHPAIWRGGSPVTAEIQRLFLSAKLSGGH